MTARLTNQEIRAHRTFLNPQASLLEERRAWFPFSWDIYASIFGIGVNLALWTGLLSDTRCFNLLDNKSVIRQTEPNEQELKHHRHELKKERIYLAPAKEYLA